MGCWLFYFNVVGYTCCMPNLTPNWLMWARRVEAISRIGLIYAEIPYDRERYEQLHELSQEMLAHYTDAGTGRIAEWFAAQPGYATPKVDVRGACFREGKILLVQERSDGAWCLPGGWADVGDVPSLAAEREVHEEAGFECKSRKLIALLDANRHPNEPLIAYHAYKIIFMCDLIGEGSGAPNHETSEVKFFARDEIPSLSFYRTSPELVAECFAHFDDPQRAATFD